MNRTLYKALNQYDQSKKSKDFNISGILGFTINGTETVEVANRPGYVWVRIHSNFSEVVQAFNDKVSPVYGLPVYIVRDDVDRTRYKIVGRDIGQYQNWQTNTNYIATHGNQHSFNPDGGGGGDVTWVYDRQIMPLSVYPSGTSGAAMVMIAPDLMWHNSQWQAVGGTGTVSLLTYKPGTGSMGSLALIWLDANGNPQIFPGKNDFDASITGGSALLPYLPGISGTYDIPLAMVRLVSGTSAITWDNIYDLRKLVCT